MNFKTLEQPKTVVRVKDCVLTFSTTVMRTLNSVVFLFFVLVPFTEIVACNTTNDCSNHGSCAHPYDSICFCDYGYVILLHK